MTRDNELLAWVVQMIQEAQKAKEYGVIEIKMEGGCIVHVNKTKGMKPPQPT